MVWIYLPSSYGWFPSHPKVAENLIFFGVWLPRKAADSLLGIRLASVGERSLLVAQSEIA